MHVYVQETLLDGDRSSLFYMSRLLMKLQSMHGLFPYLAGKVPSFSTAVLSIKSCQCMYKGMPAQKPSQGPAAAVVRDMLLRMRVEEAPQAPEGDPAIDVCVLLDRGADLVTPLMTQLTYEGLLDEVLGIRNSSVVLEQGWVDHMDCQGAFVRTEYRSNKAKGAADERRPGLSGTSGSVLCRRWAMAGGANQGLEARV